MGMVAETPADQHDAGSHCLALGLTSKSLHLTV